MDYDPEYKPIIDYILEILSQGNFPVFTRSDTSLMTKLYNEITLGNVTARGALARGDVLKTIVTGSQMTVPTPSRYLPSEIRKQIVDHQRKQYVYKYRMQERHFKIVFGLLSSSEVSDSELDKCAEKVCSWLSVCIKYAAPRCGKRQDVYIYMGDDKKRFPRSNITTIGPKNVNSGYSTVCQSSNEIVVYRSEEWFKVFIHETFHSFGFEPNDNSQRILSNFVGDLLPIEPTVSVNETYVECWARIVNSSYCALSKSSDIENYLSLVRFNLLVESMFSAIQAYRILAFMNIAYSDVINKSSVIAKTLYKEKSNVFAYYILSATFLSNPYRFLRWCGKYNTNWLQFNNSPYAVKEFEGFIKRSLHNRGVKEEFERLSEFPSRIGLRMSVVDVK